MCFNKYGVGSNPLPEYAGKDIKVYKVIKTSGKARYRGSFDVNGKDDKWVPGYIYYESTPFASMDTSYGDIEINGDALHSCVTLDDAKNHLEGGDKVVEMIIPKGSTYYENGAEYVSSALYYPHQIAKRGRQRNS